MKAAMRSAIAIVVGISLMLAAESVWADYVLGHAASGTHRMRDDGTILFGYFPPPEVAAGIEALGIDHAVTPDLQTVYQFTNSLGFSNVTLAFDTFTGAYLSDQTLQSGPNSFPPPNDDYIANALMPVIRPSDPSGAGDLFVISGNLGYPAGSTPQVKRYNRATESFVQAINPPTQQSIFDIAFGPDNRLYMAAEQGVFVYGETAGVFDLISATSLTGDATGTLAFGGDGRLYLRNVATGNVDRYELDGSLVDTFIAASQIVETPPAPGSSIFVPGRGAIHFGVDGNFHLLVGGTRPSDGFPQQYVGKFDGVTGSILSLIELSENGGGIGRLTYLPVPEPSTCLLACLSSAYLAGRRRRRRICQR